MGVGKGRKKKRKGGKKGKGKEGGDVTPQ